MSLLTVTDLSHSFGDKDLYQNASLTLYKGEHMGIVGQNGAGKSTLIKILLGFIAPTKGQIAWQRGLSIGHLDQYAEVDGALTIEAYLHAAFSDLYAMEEKLQALYADMANGATDSQLEKAALLQQTLEARDFYAIDSTVARVAAGLGLTVIGLGRRLGTLSGGQRAKVILAKLLLQKPDVLLLDEPTNFLDAPHIAWLTAYLSAYAGAFLIVSHDVSFLDGVTTCILDIEFQTLRKYHGRYSDFVRQKAHLREEYVRRYTAQQREIEALTDYIARNKARASTANMAKSRQKKLNRMEKLAPTSVQARPDITFASTALTALYALTVQGLEVGYAYPLLPKLSFSIAGGQKTVLTGFNGIGKSTLLKTLTGRLAPLGGSFSLDPQVKIGYFEQELVWADGDRTPFEILSEAYPALWPKQIRRELARYGVRAEHVLRPVRTLSGGEQNKVKLCRLSLCPHNFLILDEPTNHLDAETKGALHEALVRFEGSVLLVCHETAFYQGFADRVIDLEKWLR